MATPQVSWRRSRGGFSLFYGTTYGNGKAEVGIMVTTVVSNVMWVAGMLVAFGVIFDALTNIPFETGIIIGAVIVFTYTMLGGMWAVAMTDFVQMIIIKWVRCGESHGLSLLLNGTVFKNKFLCLAGGS